MEFSIEDKHFIKTVANLVNFLGLVQENKKV